MVPQDARTGPGIVALALLLACNPTGSVVLKGDTGAGDTSQPDEGDADADADTDADTDADSDADTDSDTDADADADTDADSDADTDADTDADADPYPRPWEGTRMYVFEGDVCTDTIYEEGIEVTHEDGFGDLLAACSWCEEIYYIEANPESICSGQLAVDQEIYRGITRDGDKVTIYIITEDDWDWVAYEYAVGADDGDTVTYTFSDDISGYDFDVYGEISFD